MKLPWKTIDSFLKHLWPHLKHHSYIVETAREQWILLVINQTKSDLVFLNKNHHENQKNKNENGKEIQFVTTPTQPPLNSNVGFDMKMTLDHHHHPTHTTHYHHKLNVINISAIPDLILTKL